MTNKMSPKKHGLHGIEGLRPKKKNRVKLKRPDMRARQLARQSAIATAVAEFETQVGA